ncbi:MaoC/PaaZ C-terminal domain-containing protein [Labrenzia sp. 011]|uniref:MaoC/PaaZ C-terminal domain-containing protein n=1 Tax=Labrenzia sp. 011 TaxID=2171494 RepID=UPI000D50EE42|nr:MaoC/PaaZ C-terminal domain-containing protein [Labrenzia sp. 011]PVB61782.1 hydratase [Labrenzia sp. 011]
MTTADEAQGTHSFTWIPRQADFDAFADLSGDDNPIHVDPAFSARTRFGRTVSHGMLLYTRVFARLQALYPGRAHRVQTLMFPNPAYADEELTISFSENPQQPDRILIEVARSADGAVTLSGTCDLGERR